MIKTILSIAGKPGLFRLVSQGKNMLIVEDLMTKKRMPAYAHDKVVSLGDIAMYTEEEDVPLAKVLESVKTKFNGESAEVKKMSDSEVRTIFSEILPSFDDERVYTSDIRKLFAWYNLLIKAGITEFEEKEEETKEDQEA